VRKPLESARRRGPDERRSRRTEDPDAKNEGR
jgi:hypothetical protein